MDVRTIFIQWTDCRFIYGTLLCGSVEITTARSCARHTRYPWLFAIWSAIMSEVIIIAMYIVKHELTDINEIVLANQGVKDLMV